MSNLPALPSGQGLETLLRPSFPTLAESLVSDEALPYVPPGVATRALEIVDQACVPATHDELTFALGWLASVTTGDKLRSPEMMQISARSLVEAMREYPADAALGAIRDWPKTENGKWWPTENELRTEADARGWQAMRMHRHLRAAALRDDARAPRSNEPSPLHLGAYLDAVRETFGEPFIKSWLSPLTCQYQGKTIWTHPLGAERLTQRTNKLMEEFDVVIRSDKEAQDHFRRSTEHFEARR